MTDFAAARRHMIESQLRPSQVDEPAVLAAMGEVPRERFVPEALQAVAYVDEDVPLGGGRWLIAPLVTGRLLQLAAPNKGDRALDIGCGSGYSTALLAKLSHDVVAVEPNHELAERAAKRLRELGLRNAWVVEGPLAAGHAARGPYDVILVDGALEAIPQALEAQLAEGGRLVAVVRPRGQVGRITLATRRGGLVSSRQVWDAATPPLPVEAKREEFVF